MRTCSIRTNARLLIAAALVIAGAGALVGCGAGSGDEIAAAGTDAPLQTGFHLIEATAANEMLGAPPDGLVVLDVRTPEEFAAGHLNGAQLLDFQSPSFVDELGVLDRDTPYLVYCHSGNRSAQAVAQMQELGFTTVFEIAGGVTAWQEAGYTLTR